MRRYNPRLARCFLIVFLAVACLWLGKPLPVAAQSLAEYFKFEYNSANLSQSNVIGDAAFFDTVSAYVTCIKDLPLSVSEASITSRVVAEDPVKGTVVTLNPGYTVTIAPFPSKEGDTRALSQTVPLRFPPGIESGDYTITAQLVDAKVKAFFWVSVKEFLPQSQVIGSVKYTAAASSPAPSPAPPTPVAPVPSPAAPLPTVALPAEKAPAAAQPEPGIGWCVWLAVAIAAATALINITFWLRDRILRRTRK